MPPLLSIETNRRAPYEQLPVAASASEDEDSVLDFEESNEGGPPRKRKRWWSYLPLILLIFLMFAPQYSVVIVLVSYFLQVNHTPLRFIFHLGVIYTLTFLACCSLLVCVVRDPGAVRVGEGAGNIETSDDVDESEDTVAGLLDALRMPVVTKTKDAEDDFNAPHKWCKRCWAPKPERTHHCSACGRCVLKMDHHCPWLAQKCVGHWTYTAFLHFLLCITLLAAYVSGLCSRIVYVAFFEPFRVDEITALHALFLTIYGAIFSLVVGSFFLWHVYLVSTNQTTIENLSPFLLLRYLPSRPPPTGTVNLAQQRDISHIPREHQLSSAQRRRIRYAHGHLRMYDVGWRQNWTQIVGIGKRGWKGWAYRILCGGSGFGDGRVFPRNPRADSMLARLAAELEDEDKLD